MLVAKSSILVELGAFSSPSFPEKLYEAKHLRSFLLFLKGGFRAVPHRSYTSFKYMRELDLSGCGLEVLDDSIGDLVCLNNLDVPHRLFTDFDCKTSWFYPVNEDEDLPLFGNQLQTLPFFVVARNADLVLLSENHILGD
ncbi:hypothetical protein FEM48_Zijuj09G0090200 [Ziziphus jujuba var. spinosa]|uniref:Uncharacterized protein n=1 Tax=Ziziphus jujuba var. spinosa TaxID=714518 RepID=A0A978US30_ZIZJJ|nr:hypothetical protein FEM48_Zijuj09G0090200 [Ziziphus jujuba var. spinosa]